MSTAFKLNKYLNSFFKLNLKNADKELYTSIEDEFLRQQNHIELIASENIVSKAVLEAQDRFLQINTLKDIQAKDITVDVNMLMFQKTLQLKEQKNYLIVILQMYNHIQVLRQMVLFILLC